MYMLLEIGKKQNFISFIIVFFTFLFKLFRFRNCPYTESLSVVGTILTSSVVFRWIVETKLNELDVLNLPEGYVYVVRNRKIC
jgi:hypothetical protein